jgi:hypothetical protein
LWTVKARKEVVSGEAAWMSAMNQGKRGFGGVIFYWRLMVANTFRMMFV